MSNKSGTEEFFEHSLHLPSRTIFVGGEVNQEMAEFFLKAMHLLTWRGSGPITVIADNVGGDFYHGLGMYDVIVCCQWPVQLRMYGNAMSMGSLIPQASDDRVMAPNCTMMLHYGEWGGYHMDSTHVATNAAENARLVVLMESIYLGRIRQKHPKFGLRRLREILKRETYLSAREACDLGLVDSVMKEW